MIIVKRMHNMTNLFSLYFQIKILMSSTYLLLARGEVGSHDTGLLSSDDLSGEDTSEGVETTLVGGRYHLAHVHHEGSFGVTVLNNTTVTLAPYTEATK